MNSPQVPTSRALATMYIIPIAIAKLALIIVKIDPVILIGLYIFKVGLGG